MRPINLIPPEDRRGERAPLRTGGLVYGLVGLLLLGFVGVYLYVSAGNTVDEREAQVASLEQQVVAAAARAQALKSFSDFASLEQERSQTVSSLAQSRFDWQRVMRELAFVIPDGVALTGLTGSVGGESDVGGDGGPEAAEGVTAPSLAMTGCADDHGDVAHLVAALRDIDGVTRVGLSSAERPSAESGAAASGSSDSGDCLDPNAVTFEVTAAFDEVPVAPVTPAAPAPSPAEGADGGVGAARAGRDDARGSVDAARGEADEAVDELVPGA